MDTMCSMEMLPTEVISMIIENVLAIESYKELHSNHHWFGGSMTGVKLLLTYNNRIWVFNSNKIKYSYNEPFSLVDFELCFKFLSTYKKVKKSWGDYILNTPINNVTIDHNPYDPEYTEKIMYPKNYFELFNLISPCVTSDKINIYDDNDLLREDIGLYGYPDSTIMTIECKNNHIKFHYY